MATTSARSLGWYDARAGLEPAAGTGLRVGHVVKRAIDITVAAVVLLLAVPLLAVLAAVVRLSSPGPALFRQVRVGRRGRPFRILKLRTMVTDAEARLRDDPELLDAYMANHFKLPPDVDPRLTAVGKLLRRTSLDELPQLFNVLRGEMSLVGVRPVVPGELDLYGDAIVLYEHFKPGITGYWQVQGRSGVAGADRIELDRFYFENWNVWLDLKILVRTVPAVFRCSGAH